MQCRVEGCGETFDNIAQVSAHYREAHPGQRSGGKDSARKRKERERKRAKAEAAAAPPEPPDPDFVDVPIPDPGDDRPAAEETPPEVQPAPESRRGWRDRLWGARESGGREPSSPRSRERPPRRKRESTAGLFSMAWGGLGAILVRTEADVPVGRCMQLQATVAGPILEDATKDTFIDQALQPFAGRLDKLEAVWALVMVPALVGVIERGGPETAVALEPMLRAALRTQLAAMVPVLRKRRAEDEKHREVVAELVEMGEAAPGVDPVDAILSVLFADLTGEEPAPGTPDANGGGEYDPAATFAQP